MPNCGDTLFSEDGQLVFLNVDSWKEIASVCPESQQSFVRRMVLFVPSLTGQRRSHTIDLGNAQNLALMDRDNIHYVASPIDPDNAATYKAL